MLYFSLSVLVLSLLLFYPVTKLVWVLSVRRLQRLSSEPLSEQAIQGQRSKARFIAALLAFVFSLLFNLQLLGLPQHG